MAMLAMMAAPKFLRGSAANVKCKYGLANLENVSASGGGGSEIHYAIAAGSLANF
jgi:hypothetical protein